MKLTFTRLTPEHFWRHDTDATNLLGMAHVRRVLYYTAKSSRTNQVNYLRTLFSIKTTTITKHWYFESFEPFNWTIQFTVSVNDSTQGNVFVWTAYENSLKDVWFQWMVLESKNYFTNTSDHIGTVFESCGTKKEWWRFDAIPEFYYSAFSDIAQDENGHFGHFCA